MKSNHFSGKITAFLLVFIVLSACFLSCTKEYHTEDEIRDELSVLLPLASEINEIYFGNGLPFNNDESELEHFFSSLDYDVKDLNYAQVDPESGYEHEEDIRNATRRVFTEEYSEFLFERAFTGLSDKLTNEEGQEFTTSAVYARFIEEDGILTQRLGLEAEAFELGREYDLNTLKIIKQKNNYVVVEISSELKGEFSVVKLKMMLTGDGWRLDSPTY